MDILKVEPEEVRDSGPGRRAPPGKNPKNRSFAGKFTVYSAITQKFEKILEFSMEIIHQTNQGYIAANQPLKSRRKSKTNHFFLFPGFQAQVTSF